MLDIPPPDDDGVRAWVAENLGDLCAAEDAGSPSGARPPARGGQQAADAALQAYDVKGYARRRNNVWPASTRGASMLSPYIRHGLLTLPEVWDHVASGPPDDVAKFRDELRWQEYARHLYARVGTASRRSLRYEAPERNAAGAQTNPWDSDAVCLQSAWSELVREPPRLAVDRRSAHRKGLRLLALAGRKTRPGPVRHLPAGTPPPDRRLATHRRAGLAGAHRPAVAPRRRPSGHRRPGNCR